MNILPSRREFLKTAGLFSVLGVAPQFLTRTVESAAKTIHGFKDDRILVVVQLGGGNDGLNTIVPYTDDTYYRLRPQIGLKRNRLIPINDTLAFNDRLVDFMRLYDDGKLAIVQGVGYPNPDRSHFRSMEIWHTASPSDQFYSTGWAGRYFDHHCGGSARPQAGVAIGQERPQAFEGAKGFGVAFDDPRRFGWEPGHGADTEENFAQLNAPSNSGNGSLDFLRHVTSSAIMSSKEVNRAAEIAGLADDSPQQFARALKTVAGLIRGGLDTRIYFVSASGFDTHANQPGVQDNLFANVGRTLHDFQSALQKDGTAGRVVTMVFSEFGRRVAENASRGTDHGAAAPMFFLGDPVQPGTYGQHPSLTDLHQGDLKHQVDFRSAYATVLENWFGVEARPILNQEFAKLPLFG